jgi:DNA primase
MNNLVISLFESFLGECKGHNEMTNQAQFDCPACSADKNMLEGDGKGNLEINYGKDVFKCWACQDVNDMQGSISKLINKFGSKKIKKAYKELKPDIETFEKKEFDEVLVNLPEEYKKLSECTEKDFKASLALNYLYERGITNEIIHDFQIGYAYMGKYYNRIIIPSYDSNNKLNYFISRWFSKEYTKLKYLNPDVEKQEIIFNEGKLNLDSTIYLVEGVTDHIVTPNSIPLLGKHISPKLLELLHDKAKSYVVIVLDGDAYNNAKTLYNKLNFGNLKNKIKIVKCPDDYDPSKIFEKLGNKGIVKLLMNAKYLTEWEK